MLRLVTFHSRLSLYKQWIKRWRCWPVKDWVDAAQHYRAARYDKAQHLYRRGLAANPASPARVHALLDLSHCAFRLKDYDEAEYALRQAVACSPGEREPYVRLARLQLWLGYATEAAWTMRACLGKVPVDPELATIFITAVVESGGVSYLVDEAREVLSQLHCEFEAYPRLEVARVRLALLTEDFDTARDDLARLAALDRGPFDAVVAYAQVLLDEGKTAYARHHLHRALVVSSENPRVLRMLASSYLKEGVFFEPEFAVQLATVACQFTSWKGVHEMHTLAEAYASKGDKMSALLVATRAKETGGRLLGSYRDSKHLDRLIQRLSQGTQV